MLFSIDMSKNKCPQIGVALCGDGMRVEAKENPRTRII